MCFPLLGFRRSDACSAFCCFCFSGEPDGYFSRQIHIFPSNQPGTSKDPAFLVCLCLEDRTIFQGCGTDPCPFQWVDKPDANSIT